MKHYTSFFKKRVKIFSVFTLTGCLLLVCGWVRADCAVDASGLYTLFKKYRQQVNSANTLQQLTPYFTSAFNRYYTDKLENPESAQSRSRYLTQYWDNLNTGRDIIIVYDYSVSCSEGELNHETPGRAVLSLLSILDQPKAAVGGEVDLWLVKIHYFNENQRWLIDSMEYTKSLSKRIYGEQHIIDNFMTIR